MCNGDNAKSNNAYRDCATTKTHREQIPKYMQENMKNNTKKKISLGFASFFFTRAVEIPLADGTSFLGTGTGFLSSGTRLFGSSGTLKDRW